jgi:ribonuclease HII
MPDLQLEQHLHAQGYSLIAGIDEAGRGAWAGPVVAAAVILPLELGAAALMAQLAGVDDSKRLRPAARAALLPRIVECARAVGVGGAGPGEVDRDGIVSATRAAMIRAVAMLSPQPDHLLIDAVRLPQCELPQTNLIRGDSRSLSIAAASVVAKVARDELMAGLDERYPGYGFGRHKGYGTAAHRQALGLLGAAEVHRMSYAPLAQLRINL